MRAMTRASMITGRVVRSARHGEIGAKRNLAAFPAIDFRDGANHGAGVEHMIVEREIIAGDVRDPQPLLQRPPFRAQFRGFAQKRPCI